MKLALFTHPVPQLLLVSFIAAITWFTYNQFFINSLLTSPIGEVLFYFMPSFIMLSILLISWRHVRFSGIIIILISLVFLLMYPVLVSIFAFTLLLFTATLFLIDDYKSHHILKSY